METLILNTNTANSKQLSGFEQLLGETEKQAPGLYLSLLSYLFIMVF